MEQERNRRRFVGFVGADACLCVSACLPPACAGTADRCWHRQARRQAPIGPVIFGPRGGNGSYRERALQLNDEESQDYRRI